MISPYSQPIEVDIPAGRHAQLVYGHDVGMIQRCGYTRLPQELAQQVRIGAQFMPQAFDRQVAHQIRVPQLVAASANTMPAVIVSSRTLMVLCAPIVRSPPAMHGWQDITSSAETAAYGYLSRHKLSFLRWHFFLGWRGPFLSFVGSSPGINRCITIKLRESQPVR